jgi:type IV pilus biogenesis protein CpaD/CtpE
MAVRALRGPIAVIAAAVALGVSGCATADTAAIVNGHRIAESEVQDAVTLIHEVVPQAQLDTSTALQLLVFAPFVNPVADRAGKGISDSQARASVGDDSGVLNEAALDLIKASDLLNPQNPNALDQQQQAEAIDQLRKAKVTLNPRYGTFDAKNMKFDASKPNWIKAQPSANPAG